MYRSSNTSFFKSLPPLIRKILIATLVVTLFSLLMGHFFTQVLRIPSPIELLSLSKWGLNSGCIWQLLSYLFLQPIAGGFSFETLLSTFFQLYLFQWIGKTLIERRGNRDFLALFFGGALFVALAGYLFMLLTPLPLVLFGSSYVLSILFMAWAFLFPDASILLFFVLPVRAKWLAFGYFAFQLLSSFSSGHFFSFFLHLAALCYGYFYPLLVWEMVSPFRKAHSFEQRIIYHKKLFIRRLFSKGSSPRSKHKIYSFETGKKVEKEGEVINACLEKISTKGKKSLTLLDRWRLWKASRKARKK